MTGLYGTTQGPWDAWSDETALRYIDSPKYPTAKAVMIYADEDCEHHSIADCSANHTCRMDWECEANARAIAQVPAMLALVKAVADDTSFAAWLDHIAAARAITDSLEEE